MTEQVKTFLKKHNFVVHDIQETTRAIMADMSAGLAKKNGGAQPMIVASDKIPSSAPTNKSVIVIDAGGTNFRSCLVTFDANGTAEISELEKTVMPAVDRELSREEFYDAIAKNLEHLKNRASKIGFCFSYAMEITPDGDGRVLNFSKEVKAPEVVGTLVGAELLAALKKHGWNSIEKITMLNDTMASLLSGAVGVAHGKKYSSYIGLILGTGLNTAYIENDAIPKLADSTGAAKSPHIIVCESALFDKLTMSDFDSKLDEKSVNPGLGLMEKQCSGAYFGIIAKNMIDAACEDKIISEKFFAAFKNSVDYKISAFDIDCFLSAPFDEKTKLGTCLSEGTREDVETLYALLETLYERSSSIVTALLSACVLKSGKGVLPTEPVCIEANGTMFWKGYRLYEKILAKMKAELWDKHCRYYEIIQVENDITLGTAIAGCI